MFIYKQKNIQNRSLLPNKENLIKWCLFVFSRPTFFNFFYYLNKICLYAMNRSSAAFLSPEFSGEKEALDWIFNNLKSKKQLTILDCGGSIGGYASLILNAAQKFMVDVDLHVFEPSQLCFNNLQKSIGSLDNVHVYQLAISDSNSSANLYYPWVGCPGASLSNDVSIAQRTGEMETRSEEVNLITLDTFCNDKQIEHIDYIKLDIEGYEVHALRGMCQMLNNGKVSYIQLELGAASLATKSMLFDAWNLLESNYNFYLILNRGLVKIDEYKPDLECFHGASNFILELK